MCLSPNLAELCVMKVNFLLITSLLGAFSLSRLLNLSLLLFLLFLSLFCRRDRLLFLFLQFMNGDTDLILAGMVVALQPLQDVMGAAPWRRDYTAVTLMMEGGAVFVSALHV